MITGELKSKVDRIWDTMWSGGISNPLSVIEQLTYLLFIKRLDELHTLRERKAARTAKPIEEPIFNKKQGQLRWSRFKETAPETMFETVKDKVFPFIKTLGSNGGSEDEGDSTYSHHMKDAIFMMPTPRVLANVVDQLDGIDMADADTKGDLYEYMLGKIATAGQNGQFRTPRHIIRLMVDMTAPTPKDVICDPACGTAGFLIAASEFLRQHHGDAIYKTGASRRKFNSGTFHGYDFDSTMLRIGSMNMLLHGVENPDIRYRDSLAQSDQDDAERFSLVLAKGLKRQKIEAYPEEVLREAVVNAVAHRDYSDPGAKIAVEVYADRLLVRSPGDPPGGQSPERLASGEARSRLRNPLIVQGLAWLEFMDERGSGIPRMTRLLEQAGHPKPSYRVDHDSLVLELRPAEHVESEVADEHPQNVAARDTQQQTPRAAILTEVRASGTITTRICVQRLGIPSATARRHFADLVADGVLVREGTGPSTRYRLIEPKKGQKRSQEGSG